MTTARRRDEVDLDLGSRRLRPSRHRAASLAAAASCSIAALIAWTSSASARPLAMEERIAARRAVEEVLWRHRVWPPENPGPRPALDQVLPDDLLRRKVEDDLAKSEAVAALWGRGISRADLQSEIDRMAAFTKDPSTLREIFAALEDDADLVAEAVARPALADRLIRNRYAFDPRFHDAVREEAIRALSRDRSVGGMRSLGGEHAEVEWVRNDGPPGAPPRGPGGPGLVGLEPGPEWDRFVVRLADMFERAMPEAGPGRRPAERPDPESRFHDLPTGLVSRLQETEDAFFIAAVVEKEPGRVRLATVTWPKQPFDEWWASVRARYTPAEAVSSAGSASALSLPAITGSSCSDDAWSAIRTAWIPEERDSHTAVWTGSEMIVWGGAGILPGGLSTGGRYSPSTDTWTPTSAGANVPSPRWSHSAVWTGAEMVVWGGRDGFGFLDTGGRYSPTTDSWLSTSTGAGVASARDSHTAVWTGTQMIVWGGNELDGFLNTGARYDPSTDSWNAVSHGANVPDVRWLHTAVWTGTEMIVWGGYNDLGFMNTGGRYRPASDSWSRTSTGPDAPPPRGSHSAVWTGSLMIVWGGLDGAFYLNTGARYEPTADSWAPTSVGANVPAARERHSAIWTGTEMIVWGGMSEGLYVNTGGRYTPSANAWAPTSTANVPAARAYHSTVWTGAEMVVWGGYFYDVAEHILDSGGRYMPSSDTWVPTVGWSDPRRNHTAIWTGTEMIVWGGERLRPPVATVSVATGGRYTPAVDTWTATPTGGATPSRRSLHTAVWTGTEMIVWGGSGPGMTNTGGRYHPAADTWTATPTGTGVPTARALHTAVWSGSEMIVWGGTSGSASLATGARYNPSTGSWSPTAAGPQGRYAHTGVWTGTEMIVWGGTSRPAGGAPTRLNSGGRYIPSSNTWTATSTGANVPSVRESHTVSWTGATMIVWGGYDGTAYLNTGGRYDVAADSWMATSTGVDVPAARAYHTAVWASGEMIVWGGSYNDGTLHFLDSGGRYDPSGDSWSATSTATNLPPARDTHTAVWTSGAMIVWGGRGAAGSLANGASYCAVPCASAPVTGQPIASASASGTDAVISWTPVAEAAAYDLVRGGLKSLRLSGGNYTTATNGCLADDTTGTSFPDPDLPPAGDGFWYLVRPVNCAGAGSYDEDSPSQQGGRDAEIDASPNACN